MDKNHGSKGYQQGIGDIRIPVAYQKKNGQDSEQACDNGNERVKLRGYSRNHKKASFVIIFIYYPENQDNQQEVCQRFFGFLHNIIIYYTIYKRGGCHEGVI